MSLAKCIGKRNPAGRHEHPRRAASSNDLPLRPAGRARRRRSCGCGRRRTAARRSCRYSLHGRADAALHQLAAGSARQLPRARSSFPEKTRELRRRGRPRRRDGGHQPVRLLPRAGRRDSFRSPTSRRWRSELAPFLEVEPPAPLLRELPRDGRSREPQRTDRLPGRAQPRLQQRHRATSSAWSPACRRREETLELAQRLVPRHRLAAGAAAAPPRPRRALRLRLPDPAHARREVARRPERRRRATSPTCTPGARSTCPAPAGSASIRPRACSPARATSRSPARPSRRAPRRSTGAVDDVRGRVRPRHDGDAHPRDRRASPSRTPRSSGATIAGARRRGRRASSPTATCG